MSINVVEAFATKNRCYQAAEKRTTICRRILRFTCGSGRHSAVAHGEEEQNE